MICLMILTKLLPLLSFPSFSIILSSSYRVFPVIFLGAWHGFAVVRGRGLTKYVYGLVSIPFI